MMFVIFTENYTDGFSVKNTTAYFFKKQEVLHVALRILIEMKLYLF